MDLPLFVHEFGPPDGVPLLALHGVTGHGGRWRQLARTRLPGYRVIAPDLRGHGKSSPLPPWTLEQHAADLLAVVDAYQLDAVAVVAHSFGGAVALHLARLAPGRVSRLLLLDPAVGIDPVLALERAGVPARTFADPREAWEAQRYDWPAASEEAVSDEVGEHLEQAGDGWRFRYVPAAVTTAWSEMARTPALPGPGLPTMLVRALQAPYVTAAFVNGCQLALDTDFELVGLDCGHVIYLERPDETAALVARFVSFEG
ncbi:MAG TPA: alpha/beta hydrolase [Pseudonocardiaceae bacterium]|jgi:lipase|nr:alpha/beta hydrolase [Pseudonocardiaceae bacterium]